MLGLKSLEQKLRDGNGRAAPATVLELEQGKSLNFANDTGPATPVQPEGTRGACSSMSAPAPAMTVGRALRKRGPPRACETRVALMMRCSKVSGPRTPSAVCGWSRQAAIAGGTPSMTLERSLGQN
jgi:hypothetical protein